jgi:hypothetical protein
MSPWGHRRRIDLPPKPPEMSAVLPIASEVLHRCETSLRATSGYAPQQNSIAIRSPGRRGTRKDSGIVSPIAFDALMFQELYPRSGRAHLASRSLLACEVIKEHARPNLIDCGFLRIRSSSRQCPASAAPSYSPPCGFPRCLCPVGWPILRCNFGRTSGASASAT